mgnify:CR=1 FL=1
MSPPLLECGGTRGGHVPPLFETEVLGARNRSEGDKEAGKFRIVGCHLSKVLNFSARCARYLKTTL